MQTQTTTPPAPVKKATAGFAISLIGGIIILINGLLILAAAALISSFSGLIPSGIPGVPEVTGAAVTFVEMLGAAGTIFAIIVIIGAILIYMPGKEIIGGILVIIFSLLSIVVGGGFILGLILGIIGGALGLAKK